MKAAATQPLQIEIAPEATVSALLIDPPQARACYVFAHGAGAGMAHASMATIAAGLADRGIATLRYQFPYMEKASKRPDSPAIALVREPVAIDWVEPDVEASVPRVALEEGDPDPLITH